MYDYPPYTSVRIRIRQTFRQAHRTVLTTWRIRLLTEGRGIFYFIGISHEVKKALRGCAARGMEGVALRPARAQRILHAGYLFQ